MRQRALVSSTAAASLLAFSSLSNAGGTPPSLDLRGFHAPTDPASGLYLEPADSPATGEFNANLWFNYVYRPITLRDPASGDIAFDVIRHQLTSDVAINVGVAHRLALGLDLPVLIYQNGSDATDASTAALGTTSLPGQGLGDLGLDAKLTLVRPTGGDFGGFSLALSERFTLPTGDEGSFLGEGSVTSETRLLGEYRLLAIGVHASAGIKLRGEEESFACGGVPDDQCSSRFGHELPFGFGFSFRPQALGIDEKGRWTWFLETHGYLPISPSSPFSNHLVSQWNASLAARYALPHDMSLIAGVETALVQGIGSAPLRATIGLTFAPRSHDVDGDGIPDDIDQCKDLPEDKDGFQDADGCPDLDNDDDGVPDAQDRCPTLKEDEDGFQDDDGCPDPDNDNDGILDDKDACPNEAGPPNDDPKKNGCPVHDQDGDGIPDDKDACPAQKGKPASDPMQNGCPNPDSDGDGILDEVDACPTEKGIASEDPKQNGCPDPDTDKDTILNVNDKCPDQPETFNGFEDEDGCPDDKPKPLVSVKTEKNGTSTLALGKPLKLTDKDEVDKESEPILRAIASELLKHPTWTISVGSKPPKKGEDERGKARANAVVAMLVKFARRPSAASVVPFDEVKNDPNAQASGVGLRLNTPPAAAVAK